MFEVNDIPPIDGCELQELIGENVRHEEFLFFRINHGDDLDWILGEAEDYECFCTACQQHFAEDRKSGPASYWDACPRCGARITPRRWNNGKAKFLALTAFAFHFFQPGEHGDMWLTSCQVRMNPDFQCGKYLANEYARYCFSEFGSRKWIWKENGWKRTKSICFKRWQAMGGYCYDNFWALPSMSSREIAALVKERDEAKAEAEKAVRENDAAQAALSVAEENRGKAMRERDEAVRNAENAKERADELQEQLDAIEDKPAEVRELTEEELEEIREKARAENAEAAKAAEERARAAEEKLDKVKNPAAHKVNFLFGEVRGLVERLEQALGELEQTDEAACEKFAAVIAKWLKERGDGLA